MFGTERSSNHCMPHRRPHSYLSIYIYIYIYIYNVGNCIPALIEGLILIYLSIYIYIYIYILYNVGNCIPAIIEGLILIYLYYMMWVIASLPFPLRHLTRRYCSGVKADCDTKHIPTTHTYHNHHILQLVCVCVDVLNATNNAMGARFSTDKK